MKPRYVWTASGPVLKPAKSLSLADFSVEHEANRRRLASLPPMTPRQCNELRAWIADFEQQYFGGRTTEHRASRRIAA